MSENENPSAAADCSPFSDLPPVYWRLIGRIDHAIVRETRSYALTQARRRREEMGNYLIALAWK